MNLFVLFCDGAITRKKWRKLCIMRHAQWCSFPSFFFSGDTPSLNKKINSSYKSINSQVNINQEVVWHIVHVEVYAFGELSLNPPSREIIAFRKNFDDRPVCQQNFSIELQIRIYNLPEKGG
jgi:hypothetical protein